MYTGDLATMDVDGYVNITGRLKDMVIRGGENISPREIEEFLHNASRHRRCRLWESPTLASVRSSWRGCDFVRERRCCHRRRSARSRQGRSPPSRSAATSRRSRSSRYRRAGRFARSRSGRWPWTFSGRAGRGRRARICTQRGRPPQRVLVDIPQNKGSRRCPTTNQGKLACHLINPFSSAARPWWRRLTATWF